MLKYEFTEETRLFAGRVLHRIVAVEDLPCSGIRKGDLGGFIEAEHNLSHKGIAWVSGDAMVLEDAHVCDSAWVFDDAIIRGHATVSEHARVYDNAKVSDYTTVEEYAVIRNDAYIGGRATVRGRAVVEGQSKVIECAQIYDDGSVHGSSIISGRSQIYEYATVKDSQVSGDSQICGDIAVENAIVTGNSLLQYGRFTGHVHDNLKKTILASMDVLPNAEGIYRLYKYVRKIGDGVYASDYDSSFFYYDLKFAEESAPCEDKDQSCAAGLHASTPSYWHCAARPDTVLIAVDVNIDDIITCMDGKVRCRKMFVVGEVDL